MWNEAGTYNWMVHHADLGMWLIVVVTALLMTAIVASVWRGGVASHD